MRKYVEIHERSTMLRGLENQYNNSRKNLLSRIFKRMNIHEFHMDNSLNAECITSRKKLTGFK